MKSVLTACFILISQLSFSQSKNAKFSFSKINYSLEYPSNWRLDTTKTMGTVFFLFSPAENSSDKFSENANLIIQDLSGQNVNLITYKQFTENQLQRLISDYKLFESVIVKSDNKEFYKINYSMSQGQFILNVKSFCFISNEKAYLLTFTTEIDKNEMYKIIGDEILNSFVLKN